jgi:hypothetical protein
MDIISHGLYGGVAFGRKSKWDYFTAFMFGVGPDLMAFGPYCIAILLGFQSFPQWGVVAPHVKVIPHFVYALYSVSHSLVIYGIFLGVLLLFGKRKLARLTLGWPLHILVDLPTHSNNFFPTPIFWPVSSFHINGIPWSEPIIFLPNIIVISCLYLYWYYKNKQHKSR